MKTSEGGIDMQFLFQALIKFVLGLLMIGLLVLLPAGTINYWNGWLLMGYIGKNTKSEIEYAKTHGKTIEYLKKL